MVSDDDFGVCDMAIHEPGTTRYQVELRGKSLQVFVKADGCVDVRRFYNCSRPGDREEECDYIHICDLEEFISDLQRIKELSDARLNVIDCDASAPLRKLG